MKTDEHLYTLTRTEFAKEIGKSREAVKIGMRRGKYKDLYIFKDGKYFFKSSLQRPTALKSNFGLENNFLWKQPAELY